MRKDRRHSYVRLLGKLIVLVGRGAPLPLLAMVVVSLAVMGTNVLVFHLLETVLSQLADPERLSEIAGAILVAGAVILIRELLEMVADPIAAYVVGKGSAVLTEAMNQKVGRLEVIDFETVDANERLELAKAGTMGAISMLMTFLFPVFQVTFFATAAIYLHSLSPLLALVVPLTFVPRIASHLVRGSRYYQLERKTVPMLREFQYLERCLTDREYFKETRILGAGSRLAQRYRSTLCLFNVERWREDLRIGGIDLALSVLVLLGYAGSFVLAAFLLADGSIGVGGFAVVIYAVSRLMMMTRAVMDMFGQSYRASATASHLFEFLERDEGRPMGDRAGETGGAVTARRASFTYPGTDTAAVDDVNVVLADATRAEDEEAVIRALERGGVPAELWQGEEGLDLMLSREFGTRDLSLGQWQRVAIARGLFREHDLILLDEPTASIDPLEEQAVYERFMEIAAGNCSNGAACTTRCSRPKPIGTSEADGGLRVAALIPERSSDCCA